MNKYLHILFNISIYTLGFSAEHKKTIYLEQLIMPGSLVFDVGAHIGAKTDLYLSLGAQVLCIEPQPACIKVLKQKYQNNPQVAILNQGLSDSAGEMQLLICSKSPTISTFSEEWQHGRFKNYSWDQTATVQVTTLDAVIEQFGRPQFCKIDVEGYEYHVLKGLSQPIDYISLEFTKELFKNSKLCIYYLVSLGYNLFNYAVGENLEFAHIEWITAEALIQEIEMNSDPLLWGDIYAH